MVKKFGAQNPEKIDVPVYLVHWNNFLKNITLSKINVWTYDSAFDRSNFLSNCYSCLSGFFISNEQTRGR